VNGGREISLLARKREGDARSSTRLKRSSAVVPAGTKWVGDPPTEESGGGKAFVEDAESDKGLKRTSQFDSV
jgi:hypothetical protein